VSLTLTKPPAEAAAVFGDALPRLEQYAALLAGPGTERGLLGPREVPRLWERHLLNCAGLSELVREGEVVLDLGSGAGLPGLVLALQRPDVQVVLVESLQRRAAFLSECVEQLGLRNTLVRRARGEELHGKVEVDVVTARAVAPVDRLAGWALPLLREGGRLLALKGEQAAAELELARPVLARLGATASSVVEVGASASLTQGRIVVVEAGRVQSGKQRQSGNQRKARR
jgi:16S rRNA (guanine527-N7)-methyltransferase